ncbi:glycosyltransferase family A protein [Azospirillum soli]|uniref:glycosyltransferase family A protein n=1 Tax=Azospirillum soli TaxID=1304799 RepID=UPI001AE2AE52|nr:glycosyltransferase family A protein [Azospirillum soli]MBP2316244.1 hypothetical protein [Azospirillum soli]
MTRQSGMHSVRAALIAPPGLSDEALAEDLHRRLATAGVDVARRATCDDLDGINPSFVMLMSPQHARLTRFPTYGVLRGEPEDYLWSTRLVRNVLTWDSCLTETPRLGQWVGDLCFGIRKAGVVPLDLGADGDTILRWHADNLVRKGYLPDPDERPDDVPSVGIVVRTGGARPMHLLRRALRSLEAQHWPNLEVVFVCFRPFPELPAIAAEFPSLRWQIVDDFGRRRSSALRAGVAAMRTDLFGMLDDDDEMFPHHIRTLVNALRRRNRLSLPAEVGMVHTGTVMVSETEPLTESEIWEDDASPDLRERRVIEHFQWFRPERMARHCNIFMSNSFLARTDLVDAEMLSDPAIHTGEDMDFQFLLVQKTGVAFTAEVTAIHHFHGHGHSNYQDVDGTFSDTLRIGDRMCARLLPDQRPFFARRFIFPRRRDPFRIS